MKGSGRQKNVKATKYKFPTIYERLLQSAVIITVQQHTRLGKGQLKTQICSTTSNNYTSNITVSYTYLSPA